MKRFLFVLALSFALAAVAAADPAAVRLDITSQPSGASVCVDGETRGVTPLTLMDIAPGRHLMSVSLQGFRTADEFISIEPGAFTQKNYELAAEKGLLLVRTDPAGAEVAVKGVSLGATPLLVTTLDAAGGPYQLSLSMNGYQRKTVPVVFEGRTPLVIDEKLTLDSGILEISTDPAGAEVIVNGVNRGTTPVTVERVPRGTASVVFKLNGFRDVTREVRVGAGDHINLAVPLKGRPSKLTVVTDPEKARVYVDDEFQGRSPADIPVLGGRHRVRVELPGYAMSARFVEVPNGSHITEEFRLASIMGRLEVTTQPPGAEVWIDDKKVGVTRNPRAGAKTSFACAIEDLVEGEHTLVLKLKGYEEKRQHFEITPKKTTELKVALKRLFIPDIEITTASGSIRKGVLVEQTIDGGYIIEVRPGVEQTIPGDDVKSAKMLEL